MALKSMKARKWRREWDSPKEGILLAYACLVYLAEPLPCLWLMSLPKHRVGGSALVPVTLPRSALWFFLGYQFGYRFGGPFAILRRKNSRANTDEPLESTRRPILKISRVPNCFR
jgi:hypothetical protein